MSDEIGSKWYSRFRTESRKGYEDFKDVDWEARKHKSYGNGKIDTLFLIYFIFIILWGILVWYLHPSVDWKGWLIMFLPWIVFFIAIWYLDSLSVHVENIVGENNFLTTGLFIAIPLMALVSKDITDQQHNSVVNKVVLFAVTFAVLSMIDIWLPEKLLSIVNHLRSIFQTMSITLIIFSMYYHYYHLGRVNLKPIL